MSIADVRQAFNNGAAGKIKCTRALLVYCDSNGRQGGAKRDHQLLIFNCADGKQIEKLIAPGEDVNAVALQCGQEAVSG